MVEPNGPQPPPELLETIANLARFHREHEQFYSQAPLATAIKVQAGSRALKALAGRWAETKPSEPSGRKPVCGRRGPKPAGAGGGERCAVHGG